MNNQITKIAFALQLGICFLATGCGDDPIPPVEGSFDDEASAGAETPLQDVGPGPLDPGECLADMKTGDGGDAFGYVHQCGGWWWGRIGFTYEDSALDLYIPSIDGWAQFGQDHEEYEETKVMACCGPHDTELPVAEQPTYAENCMLDLRQQVCRSISVSLAAAINNGDLPNLQAILDVQHWISNNTSACIEGLMDTQDAPTGLKAKWEIPGEGTPWDESDHDIKNVYIEIFLSTVNDLYRPSELDDAEICTSLSWNNKNLFEHGVPPVGPGVDVTLDSGTATMLGPVMDPANGAPVQLSTSLGSLSMACVGRECSRMSVSFDSSTGSWALDELELITEQRVEVDIAGETLVVEDTRFELYGPARGQFGMSNGSTEYRIQPGEAQFLVRGKVAGELVMLFAWNSTDIIATSDPFGAWQLEPFSIQYTDAQGDPWTLMLSATDWL